MGSSEKIIRNIDNTQITFRYPKCKGNFLKSIATGEYPTENSSSETNIFNLTDGQTPVLKKLNDNLKKNKLPVITVVALNTEKISTIRRISSGSQLPYADGKNIGLEIYIDKTKKHNIRLSISLNSKVNNLNLSVNDNQCKPYMDGWRALLLHLTRPTTIDELVSCVRSFNGTTAQQGQPVRAQQGQPVRAQQGQPVRAQQGQPVRAQQGQPVRAQQGQRAQYWQGQAMHGRQAQVWQGQAMHGRQAQVWQGHPVEARPSRPAQTQQGQPTDSAAGSRTVGAPGGGAPTSHVLGGVTVEFKYPAGLAGNFLKSIAEGRLPAGVEVLSDFPRWKNVGSADLSAKSKEWGPDCVAGFWLTDGKTSPIIALNKKLSDCGMPVIKVVNLGLSTDTQARRNMFYRGDFGLTGYAGLSMTNDGNLTLELLLFDNLHSDCLPPLGHDSGLTTWNGKIRKELQNCFTKCVTGTGMVTTVRSKLSKRGIPPVASESAATASKNAATASKNEASAGEPPVSKTDATYAAWGVDRKVGPTPPPYLTWNISCRECLDLPVNYLSLLRTDDQWNMVVCRVPESSPDSTTVCVTEAVRVQSFFPHGGFPSTKRGLECKWTDLPAALQSWIKTLWDRDKFAGLQSAGKWLAEPWEVTYPLYVDDGKGGVVRLNVGDTRAAIAQKIERLSVDESRLFGAGGAVAEQHWVLLAGS